ncbi:MAG TPA: TrmH family RNA methyltransferase [Actinopolymorphaceae bacterium]
MSGASRLRAGRDGRDILTGMPIGANRQRITSGDARYQQWHALLDNRSKRHRSSAFLVQGVRPISQALQANWPLIAVIVNADIDLSDWARRISTQTTAPVLGISSALLATLGEHGDAPEVVAVATMPDDDLDRIRPGLVLLLDRPTQPGNVGSLIRSADAFGVDGVIVCGHAADPYDPAAVRASTGSLFALPVVRAASPGPVIDWAVRHGLQVVGTDEGSDEYPAAPLTEVDLTGPTLVVVGNETRGMSSAWRSAASVTAAIPMGGTASSLNAAAAGSIVLYEADRQRRLRPPPPD